jgi:hypothetical protein
LNKVMKRNVDTSINPIFLFIFSPPHDGSIRINPDSKNCYAVFNI